jgi:DNA polymerase I
VAAEVSDDAGIELEREAAFDWVAFLPRRGGDAGALTKYVARRADASPFVADLQRACLRTFDETRDPTPSAIDSPGDCPGFGTAECRPRTS